jgi:hypothetical protein
LDFRSGAEIHGQISKQEWITVAIQTRVKIGEQLLQGRVSRHTNRRGTIEL